MKPIIGITTPCERDPANAKTGGKISLNWNYAEEVARAGGVPLIIPPTADMDSVAPLLDGWLIPGGSDIDPREFGSKDHPAQELMDPARFEAESRLLVAADPLMPILGICYGCQFLNVKAGGDLIVHLPDILDHDDHSGGTMQKYQVEPGSALAAVLHRPATEGKSYHHQAVGKIGSGLRVSAHHEDGTIEALEGTGGRWLVAVQWHPERTPDSDGSRRLFQAFVAAAAAFREQRSRA